ncbi:MAG: ABC transporter ATP-binding protein [Bacteroidales bacterium]|jgi:lipoprotein-releasing system ATP-binding protein|nr:ABC transporter ATP-binding protein [Bacteroidales bacterium]
MIKAINIRKSYGNLEVLKGITLEIAKSEIVAITGASGAGKTTLLQIMSGLEKPDNGDVYVNGNNIFKFSPRSMAKFRNSQTGFIFQFHYLLPEFSVLENVMLPSLIGGTSKKNATEKARELLSFFGLSDREEHRPSEISGGESQRVAVARAMINNPSVIFADEPSGNLDTANAEQLHKLFFTLRERYGQTFVIVTHNEHLAEMSDRKIIMKDGTVKE